MKNDKTKGLQALIDYLESYHNRNYVPIIIDLVRAIYMLHYVEEDNVWLRKYRTPVLNWSSWSNAFTKHITINEITD
ncbi:MAG: hypothetical protein AAF600_18730 [Bacteroidota bacterium]